MVFEEGGKSRIMKVKGDSVFKKKKQASINDDAQEVDDLIKANSVWAEISFQWGNVSYHKEVNKTTFGNSVQTHNIKSSSTMENKTR